MTRLTQEELAEIRKRTEASTPGPWKESKLYIEFGDSSERLADVCNRIDAEFIAHAREDVPKLLAEIERLQSVNRALRLVLDGRVNRDA